MSAGSVFRVLDAEHNRIMEHMDRNEQEMEAAVQSLRDWLRLEPHLPDVDDDRVLFSMLMHSKWSITRVKEKLEACYAYKSISTDVYTENEPLRPNMQTTIAGNILLPLPKLTEDCARVVFVKINVPVDDFNQLDCIRYFMIIMELGLKYDYTCQTHFLMDFHGLTFGHVKKVSPLMLVKSITFFSTVFPTSIKGFHFVNVAPFTQSILQLARTALKEKMAERLHVHKDLDSLHSVISKKVLPVEYGGTERPVPELYADWRTFVEKHNDWVTERSKIVSNESLRTGKMPNSGLYGPEGSFRTLNVD